MKQFIIVTLSFIYSFTLYAQKYEALKLSDPHPAAGQQVWISYDPSLTELSSEQKLTGSVFFYDKDKMVAEAPLDFQHAGKLWKSSVTIPAKVVMLYVLPTSANGQLKDNNKKAGYLFPIYAVGKPVPFSYYRMSQMAQGIPIYPGELKKDLAKEITFMKEEILQHPSSEAVLKNQYYNLLANSPELDDKKLLVQRLLTVKTDKEPELMMAQIYLTYFGKKQQADSLEQLILKKFPDGEYVKNKSKKEVPAAVHTREQPAIRKAANKDYYKELKESMLNEPVTSITLKDINGNTVSLGDADTKGKIIIIDFWATWCKPCIASFPAMQKVIEKYSNNPDVKFFFICTMEPGDPVKKVSDFLKQTPFPFTFLIDKEMDEMNLYKAYTHYKIMGGIPAKLVLDKKGNIRFRSNGFSGDEEDLVRELSTMIELVSSSAE